MGKPVLPKKITVDLRDRRVYVDGEEFPWFLGAEGVDVMDLATEEALPGIRLRILAETIDVIAEDPDKKE